MNEVAIKPLRGKVIPFRSRKSVARTRPEMLAIMIAAKRLLDVREAAMSSWLPLPGEAIMQEERVALTYLENAALLVRADARVPEEEQNRAWAFVKAARNDAAWSAFCARFHDMCSVLRASCEMSQAVAQ